MNEASQQLECRGYVPEKICFIKHTEGQKLLNQEVRTIEVRLDAMDKALRMRTTELERRLEGLNELRSEVVRDRDLLVRKDIFDGQVAVLNMLKSDYIRGHQEVLTRITVIETRSIVWTAVIAALFILIQIGVHLWKG